MNLNTFLTDTRFVVVAIGSWHYALTRIVHWQIGAVSWLSWLQANQSLPYPSNAKRQDRQRWVQFWKIIGLIQLGIELWIFRTRSLLSTDSVNASSWVNMYMCIYNLVRCRNCKDVKDTKWFLEGITKLWNVGICSNMCHQLALVVFLSMSWQMFDTYTSI